MKITTIKTINETKELTQEQIIPEITGIFQNKNAYILQYTSHSVDIGYFKNGIITFYADRQFDPLDFKDLRVFNEEMEVHIIRKKRKNNCKIKKRRTGRRYRHI